MSDREHLKTCSTSYRGCDPRCPSRLADEAEERREALTSLTPSEVALAKILAAWKAWSEVGDRSHVGGQSMIAVGSALIMSGYVMPGKHQMVLTDAGVFLLDRARKAGVL